MRYADIKYPDVANGKGIRVSLFLQGCSRHCEDCFNPETWNHDAGSYFDKKAHDRLFELLDLEWVNGLSVLGGEPLEQSEELKLLLKKVKEKHPNKDIWMWTGYTFEDVQNMTIFEYVDVVVDGAFEKDKKNLDLVFRGSENQRIIELRKEK